MKKRMKFQPGDFVFLVADPEDFDEGQCPPNEIAEVMADEGRGMYMVCVPQRFRTSDTDVDGIREVEVDQMRLIARDGKVVTP